MSEEALKPIRESASFAWVSWVISFLAFYNTASLGKAGKEIGVEPRTIRDNVRHLESWLHRVLIDDTVSPPQPTQDAEYLLPIAIEILNLINEDERLTKDIHRVRVRPDGVCTIDGDRVQSIAAAKVGNLLLSARADLAKGIPHVSPDPIDPKTIDMSSFELSPELAEKLSIGKRLVDERASRRAQLYDFMQHVLEQAVVNETAELSFTERKKTRQRLQGLIKSIAIVIVANE